jgi:hypothetical protein
MNITAFKPSRQLRHSATQVTKQLPAFLFVSFLILGVSACQRADTNANSNLSANANTAITNTNANLAPSPAAVSAAREPEKYRATLVFSAQTEGGEKTMGLPTLSADIARNGADRRVAFKLPDGSDLIYLEKGDQHIVVAPARKQWLILRGRLTFCVRI